MRPAPPHTIADGVERPEGPLLHSSGRVLFGSMADGGVYACTPGGPQRVAVTGGGANGLAEGPDGRVYVAQMGSRLRPRTPGGVQVVDLAGAVDWLSLDPIAPNDLCFGADGLLYVTDPTRPPWAWDDGRIWRIDVASRDVELLARCDYYPNGIAFGLDGELIVADTSGARVLRYELLADGLSRPEPFARLPHGRPDGLAFDRDGTLYVCAVVLDGEPTSEVQVYDRDGRLLDRRRPVRSALLTNLAIDGEGDAYLTDTENAKVLTLPGWAGPGLPLHPFR